MMVSFGDFKPNELSQLIENKDPLGLNLDIENYSTINNSDIESYSTINTEQSKMEYDAILHYLKTVSTLKVSNINNNAESNSNKEKEKDTSPTLQVNPINTRPLHPVSSGNLAQKVSFKSFKNIQQLCKRSRTNSRKDEIPSNFRSEFKFFNFKV